MTTSTEAAGPAPVTIRPARYDDLPAAADMKALAWRESYVALLPSEPIEAQWDRIPGTIAAWTDALGRGETLWLALDRDGIVGLTHAFVCPGATAPNPLEVGLLYVLDRAKGRGVGSRLLATAIGDSPAHLWVLENNDAAIGFYRRAGFEPDGARSEVPPSFAGVQQIRLVRR